MTAATIPEIKPVEAIRLTEPEVYEMDNGLPLYAFNGAANEILKFEMIFDAGRWAESAPLSAAATAAMFKSGTDSRAAFEIETSIDFLGSTLKASAGYNSFTVSLYCMTRHLEAGLELLVDTLFNGNFPEQELNIYKVNALSRLKVNQRKNDYVGDMLFKELLFGPDHPYGYRTTAERVEGVDREALLDYYTRELLYTNCILGLSGRFGREEVDLINKYIGQAAAWSSKAADRMPHHHLAVPSGDKHLTQSLQDSVQASIYIGAPTISRKDPDFHTLSLLNLVYGGYFGSRLMKNIREDKGLTYGIYSYIQQYRHAAAFIINTDTAVEYVPQCLDEIYAEMDRLIQQPIDSGELRKARNYLMGRLLDQVDGPFKSASTFLGLRTHDIPLSYIKEKEKALMAIGPDALQDAARKYFRREEMYEVIVK